MPTDHVCVRNSEIRCAILGLRAKVRFPRLRSTILGLCNFLLRAEHGLLLKCTKAAPDIDDFSSY